MPEQKQTEEWITMAAAAEMFGVSAAKISRMAAGNEIQSRRDPRDKRVRRVNVGELRRYFEETPGQEEDRPIDENGQLPLPPARGLIWK